MISRVSLVLSLLSIVIATAAQNPADVKHICSRNECSCEDRDGLELVICDCGGASDSQLLLVGDPSQAYLSNHTGSLRVRRCGHVGLVSGALSSVSRLTDLELSDIAQLELQADSLYRDGDGPPRRVSLQRVADLHVDPEAFRRVTRLRQLELTEVKGELPLGSFPDDAEVNSFLLADSWMGTFPSILLNLSKAENVTLTNNTFSSLDVTVRNARYVMITDNKFHSLFGLRLNSSEEPETTDVELTMSRNNITSLGVNQLRMSLHRITLVDNTLGVWAAPLRVTYHEAVFSGNDISQLGGGVLKDFERVTDVNLDENSPRIPSQTSYFLFTGNTIRGSYMTGGLYGTFLVPTSSSARSMALFRVSGNRFSCICWELKRLIQTGEEQLNLGPTDEGLYDARTVHGQLYRSSSCLEDGRSLQQYRKDAYTAELECVRSGAVTVTAAGSLVLLLTAVRLAI